jgi:CheY-like chemotaxis protein
MLLVVDDDLEFLERATELLDHEKGIFLATDGQRARQLVDLLGTGLSVAIVDLDMPDEDGFTLIRELRRRSPNLAIVAVSGVYQEHVLESAKSIGANETLRKPIRSEWNSTIAALRRAL